jgi:hypothetical protein
MVLHLAFGQKPNIDVPFVLGNLGYSQVVRVPYSQIVDFNGRGERIRTSDPLVTNQVKVLLETC